MPGVDINTGLLRAFMLDNDAHFKRINDRFGHDVGDAAPRRLVTR